MCQRTFCSCCNCLFTSSSSSSLNFTFSAHTCSPLFLNARALGAQRQVILDGERVAGNWFSAVLAPEAFTVPFDVQSDHSLLGDRIAAACTACGKVGLEAVLAVGQAVPLVERRSDQGLKYFPKYNLSSLIVCKFYYCLPSCRVRRRQSAPRAR